MGFVSSALCPKIIKKRVEKMIVKDKNLYEVDLLIKDRSENSDEQLINNNPCLADKLIADNRDYKVEGFCYNYALNNRYMWGSGTAFDYIINNYKTIPIYKAREDDIIIFYDNCNGYGTPEHFARIYKTNGTIQGTTIRSKWGALGIYETDLYHLPTEYGGYIEVWTKKGV